MNFPKLTYSRLFLEAHSAAHKNKKLVEDLIETHERFFEFSSEVLKILRMRKRATTDEILTEIRRLKALDSERRT